MSAAIESSDSAEAELPELIPDRALSSQEADLFDHDDFVDRLTELTTRVETPANVALFAPWGSGKSSIAERLKARLEPHDNFGVVYYDAFKYARLPLLREFLVRLAKSLLGDAQAEEMRRRLYRSSQTAHLSLPGDDAATALKKARTWTIWLGVGVLIGLALVALLPKGIRSTVVDVAQALLPVLFSTGLVVALVTLVAKFLTVTTTTEVPSSEEQFETEFTKLLGQAGIGPERKKLVVFVDELDRCSPAEVVATLESLRTFLDVQGCIFIVAADRQVLEHALTEQVRQATPTDHANPYYSAGSAYLDKIFQYQMALPPLLPRRLTHFALGLVEKRGGIWKEIPDLPDAISVLLPVHVHSPRRVKVLLNSFAQAYHVAAARAERGKLQPPIAARASELAKLVSIRAEFPLFATDLAADPRLAQLVPVCREIIDADKDPCDDEELAARHPGARLRKATLYAQGKLPVAELIASSQDAPAKVAVEDEPDQEAPSDAEARFSRTRAAHSHQLVDYLQKTAQVPGPGSDLIYLEAAGAVWGLDAAIAQELQDLAYNRSADEAVELIEKLESVQERTHALELLAAAANEAIGIDADNVLHVLLRAADAARDAVGAAGGKLLSAIDQYRRGREIQAAELPGALSVAIEASGAELLRDVMAREEVLDDQDVRGRILFAAPRLVDTFERRVGEALAVEVMRNPEGALAALTSADLKPEDSQRLLHAAQPRVAEDVGTITESLDDEDESQRTAAETSLGQLVENVTIVCTRLAEEERLDLLQPALVMLCRIDTIEAFDGALELGAKLEPITNPDLNSCLLERATRVEIVRSREALSLLNRDLMSPDESELLDQLGAGVWRSWQSGELDDDSSEALLSELKRLLGDAS